MDASAPQLTRLRGVVFSAPAIRRLTLLNAVMLVAIVATGATVRLTGSGLGCHHWPGCQPGEVLPAQGYHSYIEFSNRVFAFFTILVTLATWICARGYRRLAAAIFIGTLLQAPLGALTVHFGLNPWLVLSHFLLSVVVLTLGVVLTLEARGRDRTQLPAWVPRLGILLGVAGAILLFSGTLATAAGPHPGSTVVRRLWSFQPAIYWHVRATAVFGLAFAALLGWLIRNRAPQVRAALALLGLLVVQMAIGETQYRTHLPWWLVLGHVTLAVIVWSALTVFVFSLWRPRRMVR